MSEYTNLRPSTPTPAAPAGPGKLVESRGVEPLRGDQRQAIPTGPVAAPAPAPQQPALAGRCRLPAVTEAELQCGYTPRAPEVAHAG